MVFSIIVPIYNVEPYLDRCVTRLQRQTFQNIEIILVDDESPDNCPALCDHYAQCDPRIKVIHKKNGGLSDARNAGLAVAEGEYILFVDSDDYIELDTCERFSAYARSGIDILIGEAVVEGGKCPLQHIPPSPEVYSGMAYLKKAQSVQKAPMAVWLNAYRREFLLENDLLFKHGILHEDEHFTPRALLKAKTVINTGIVFYHYIIREGSITMQKDKRKNARDLYDTFCELETLYCELEDVQLRRMLLDLLAEKYLNMFQVAGLYRYGREHLHQDFLLRNASRLITRSKVLFLIASPGLYYVTNRMVKKMQAAYGNAIERMASDSKR